MPSMKLYNRGEFNVLDPKIGKEKLQSYRQKSYESQLVA